MAYFDSLVKLVQEQGVSIWPCNNDINELDTTEVARLIQILALKIENLPPEERPEGLFLSIQRSNGVCVHLRRGYLGACLVWPPASLELLVQAKESVNPVPKEHKSALDWTSNTAWTTVQRIIQKQLDPDLYKNHVRRVYERLRADLGTHLAHYELIQRYKARCMYYDRNRLIELVDGAKDRSEAVLTRDLALYLFDNGIPTFYRLMQGVHEYDLINPSIFVEVKIYKRSARNYLLKGIAQLYGYINGLESDIFNIRELYYVIFRLEHGPLYDWPEKIETNRLTIFPITIDLGHSRSSGSRQSSVRPISQEDILKAISGEDEEE